MTDGLEAGRMRALAATAMLCTVLLSGQLGAVTHEYAHLGEVQPDLVCFHCVAGDGKTPIPASLPPVIRDERVRQFVASAFQAPAVEPLPSSHPVRAPPAIV